MVFMQIYYGRAGTTYRLAQELGAGGEGKVYEVEGKPNIIAKLYFYFRRRFLFIFEALCRWLMVCRAFVLRFQQRTAGSKHPLMQGSPLVPWFFLAES